MPLLIVSLAFLGGIFIAANTTLPIFGWILLFSLGWFCVWLKARHRLQSTVPALILLGIALGGMRLMWAQPNLNNPAFIAAYTHREEKQTVMGILIQPPDMRDTYANLRVQAEEIRSTNDAQHLPVEGKLLARVTPTQAAGLHYGDRIILEGYLQTPPENEDFSYRDYLAHQGVYAYFSRATVSVLQSGQGVFWLRAIYALQEHALQVTARLWPDPEASLLAGILLGVETGIAPDVQQAFKDTGTAHIIAISGFNITILAGLFIALFGRWFGNRRGALLTVICLAAYTLLVGADAAVVRAAIMGGLTLFARQIGRRQDALNSLGFTAALMALFNPWVLWDVGFQLSFAATLGLVLYAEPFAQSFVTLTKHILPQLDAEQLAGPVGEFFLFTLAAQITTLPIMAAVFQRVSWVALLANPVILPVQPAVMILGGIALIAGMLWLPLGKLLAALAWPVTAFTIRAVEWFAHWPVTTFTVRHFDWRQAVLYYIVLLGITWGITHRHNENWQKKLRAIGPAGPLALLSLITVLVWRTGLTAPDGRLHLYLFSVGSGQAVLVQSPGGQYLLIDGGPSALQLSDALGRRLPPFTRRLDWWLVAAPREEETAALPRNLARYPPHQVLWAGNANTSYSARALHAALLDANIPILETQAGQTLNLGQGAQIQVLAVGNRGAVLLLTWKNFRVLLPLGMDFDFFQQSHQGRDIGPLTALLLADSGYAPLNPPEWIEALHPRVALLSVAAEDRTGLPDAETLEALQGYTLLRTDRNGWIHLATDGRQLWVETQK